MRLPIWISTGCGFGYLFAVSDLFFVPFMLYAPDLSPIIRSGFYLGIAADLLSRIRCLIFEVQLSTKK